MRAFQKAVLRGELQTPVSRLLRLALAEAEVRKDSSVGLSLSDLVRRSVGRVSTWTVAHTDLERERTRELARIGSNLNQIARWANTHKENAEALEVAAHLVAIERALDTLTVEGEPR